ncbi:hypothetical protein AZA_25300 [Nitrospirillum viridazoti Y2]|nr:hypothetical protein AZA_25300 [Nitrospirillum amazonense Y2]
MPVDVRQLDLTRYGMRSSRRQPRWRGRLQGRAQPPESAHTMNDTSNAHFEGDTEFIAVDIVPYGFSTNVRQSDDRHHQGTEAFLQDFLQR